VSHNNAQGVICAGQHLLSPRVWRSCLTWVWSSRACTAGAVQLRQLTVLDWPNPQVILFIASCRTVLQLRLLSLQSGYTCYVDIDLWVVRLVHPKPHQCTAAQPSSRAAISPAGMFGRPSRCVAAKLGHMLSSLWRCCYSPCLYWHSWFISFAYVAR